MAPYYRLDLVGFRRFDRPFALRALVKRRGNDIRDEIEEHRPKYYPFATHGERTPDSANIRTVQGGYLCRCTDNLFGIIQDEMAGDPGWQASSSPPGGGAGPTLPRIETLVDALAGLRAAATARGLSYSEDLLKGFLLSLKSKPFCILAGPTGTGKSALARLLGALGADVRVVPVEPSWTDGTSIVGYRALDNSYRYGVLAEHARRAAETPDRVHVLVLDELNLARVEHYLAQWLSVVESRRFSRGSIVADPLVRDGETRVDLPDNLCVIGTVNMDESTLPFSQRVLDRANVLFLPSPRSLARPLAQTLPPTEAAAVLDPQVLRPLAVTWTQLGVAASAEEAAHLHKAVDLLQETQAKLEQHRARARVSYRLRDEIAVYVLHGLQSELASMQELLDQQVRQRLLPKLCDGHDELGEGLVKDLHALWKPLLGAGRPSACDYLDRVCQLERAKDMPVSLWTALS